MREIKFRGKRISNGKWLYGDLMHDTVGGCYVFPIDCAALYKENAVLPETIGQFTGFKDKNGKEIYEGDIIRDLHSFYFIGDFTKKIRGAYDVTQDKDGPFPVVSYYRNYAVEWGKRGSYILRNGSDQHPLCTRFRGVEVIGNIYDNPELLTK
jgi:uncharacterized phage protein (TIGR01671 family)